MNQDVLQSRKKNRRTFIKETGIAVLGSSVAFNIASVKPRFQRNEKTLKVGLIGCGSRGTGAASQALSADPDVILFAMADIFPDRLEQSYNAILNTHPTKVAVDADHKFLGFDAYKKVMAADVDVVLLATPPSFRPDHLVAAVNTGKHIFAEKPVAVDAPGIRKVLEAARKAQTKNLSIVSGFCFRYDSPKRATFGKVLDGDIGEIASVSSRRYGGELWYKPRQPRWGEMEYQMRNWYYYDWLSGDFIVEMAVHSLDMMAWAMGDRMPTRAIGTGGRQVRTDDIYGNIYDHFAIEFEYENGTKGYHFCRQQNGCSDSNIVDVIGSNGTAHVNQSRGLHQVSGKTKWKFEGETNNMYQAEHDELFASIRNGRPINDGQWMANSSMMGILGRMVAYSGQAISWDEALNSDQALGPKADQFSWELNWPSPGAAIPGKTGVL